MRLVILYQDFLIRTISRKFRTLSRIEMVQLFRNVGSVMNLEDFGMNTFSYEY
ncbi:MAG: hypothetical protein RL264_1511 [Bacteroidota bacterium]|jgi:hypothetical protein